MTEAERRAWESKRLWTLAILLLAGIAAGLLALVAASGEGLIAAVGVGVLIFLAAFATGSFLGFLFGVPRVLANETKPQDKTAVAPAPPGAPLAAPEQQAKAARARLLRSNTNLERISDWLTTMLVGAGLVELHSLNGALLQFRSFLDQSARVIRAPDGSLNAGSLPTIGPVVLIFGAAAGFLFMYLNTRLVLVRLFQTIEVDLSGEELPAPEQRAIQAIVRGAEVSDSTAAQKLAIGLPVTIEDSLNLMLDLLYNSDPDRVIELADRLANTDAVNRPDYWFYLAAAFGQKLHSQEGKPEWQSTRDQALDAARRAVALDPAYRDRLWRLTNWQSVDNDLAPLRDDVDFRRLVGRT